MSSSFSPYFSFCLLVCRKGQSIDTLKPLDRPPHLFISLFVYSIVATRQLLVLLLLPGTIATSAITTKHHYYCIYDYYYQHYVSTRLLPSPTVRLVHMLLWVYFILWLLLRLLCQFRPVAVSPPH